MPGKRDKSWLYANLDMSRRMQQAAVAAQQIASKKTLYQYLASQVGPSATYYYKTTGELQFSPPSQGGQIAPMATATTNSGPPTKFKVGDRVTLIANTNDSHNQVGESGTITMIDTFPSGINYFVKGDKTQNNEACWSLENEIIKEIKGGSVKAKGNTFAVGDEVTIKGKDKVYTIQAVHEHSEDHFSVADEDGNDYNGQAYKEDDKGGTWWHGYEEFTAVKPAITVDFDTVVIADEKRQQILEALEQINQSDLIFKKWGFETTVEKGKGVSMLFYGEPGTGKTLMAQAIANKMGYKLFIIATADIESSAPGQAERNIREAFKKAKGKKSILLFDECDSLIYSRKNVGAIMGAQINELLTQIEKFDGITLFTTNQLGKLDEAVNRRLALKLEFAMPSQAERAEIWKRMIPEMAPLDGDIDFMRLAIPEVTGGYIKNAVLRAARAAAMQDLPDDDKKINMSHFMTAMEQEAQAMVDFKREREIEEGRHGRVGPDGVVRGGAGTERVRG